MVGRLHQWSARRPGRCAPAATATAKPELTVLFGSESGNAEGLADQTAKAANGKGFKAKAVSMGDISPAKLKKVENLLVIVSTWGEGDPPENSIDFYASFMGESAPKFDGVRYSVLGLGDTSYEHFCKMGKDFDARLEALGGKRIADRKDCDVDYDDDYAAWSMQHSLPSPKKRSPPRHRCRQPASRPQPLLPSNTPARTPSLRTQGARAAQRQRLRQGNHPLRIRSGRLRPELRDRRCTRSRAAQCR